MIPDVKEVGGKPQALPLGEPEVFDQREIPVLLTGTAIGVAAKVAEAGGAEVGIGKDRRIWLIGVALRRVKKWRGGEGCRIQVAIDP